MEAMTTERDWEVAEQAIWPDGPAHGHGSGVYAGHKARVQSEIARLRAALTEIRDTARSTYSQRCQWCDPLSLAQLILRPHRPDCPAAIAAVALEAP